METKLDKRNKSILNTICNNSRLSYNQIAKITKISKDSVRTRMRKLEKLGVIKSYFTLIDHSKLNLESFTVYCKLKPTKNMHKLNIKKLIKNSNVCSITWLLGEFDMRIQISVKDKKQVKKILTETKIIQHLEDYTIVSQKNIRKYITFTDGRTNLDHDMRTNSNPIDEIDCKILKKMSNQARIRIIDLADSLNLKDDEVRYRIKKLIQNKVISGFCTWTGKSSLGHNRYLALIRIQGEDQEKNVNLLKAIKNVFYLKITQGKWDYEVRFHASSNDELVGIIYKFREIFNENLDKFKIYTILDILKFETFPFEERDIMKELLQR